MKNYQIHAFKGAGYLLGFAITVVIAVLIFLFTENVAVVIPAAVPIGTTMGILLEQKLQKGDLSVGEKGKKVLFGLLIMGIIVFLVLVFIARLV